MSLRGVTLPDLERMIEALAEGRLATPLSRGRLAACGLAHVVEEVRVLDGLDERAVAAAIQIAIAERKAIGPTPDLVWTGPETAVSSARDTAVVIRELFESARQSVLVGGFRFDHGADILAPLHAVMRDRSVQATVFLDGDAAGGFIRDNWPFGDPVPTLYADPRSGEGAHASLHAKCVIVDDRRALVTSANFTARGQTRNIEAGVLVEDPAFAAKLAGQWRALVSAGLLRLTSSR